MQADVNRAVAVKEGTCVRTHAWNNTGHAKVLISDLLLLGRFIDEDLGGSCRILCHEALQGSLLAALQEGVLVLNSWFTSSPRNPTELSLWHYYNGFQRWWIFLPITGQSSFM